jgi:glutathione peroxidase
MKKLTNTFVILIILITQSIIAEEPKINPNTISDITVLDMNGEEVQLSDYGGKVVMIINVASHCGNTPQYEGLQKIYTEYKDRGFEILAFPCNDFGGQEPGTNEEIAQFCSVNYSVQFKLFDKIKVLGDEKSKLYERLINNTNTYQGDIKWNFEKFIISKTGEIVARFSPKTQPENKEIISKIEAELSK